MKINLFAFLSALILSVQAIGQDKKVSLEDVWRSYKFYAPQAYGINSMNDGLHYTILSKADGSATIEKFSYETGKSVENIISAKAIQEKTNTAVAIDGYEFSPNEDKVLLSTETESIYRHSSKSHFYVYDLKSGDLQDLKAEGKQQLASFSPTRNQVAYVYENKMHIINFDKNYAEWEKVSFGKGEEDKYIAGALDWVYEEEFSFDKGFEWSPNGDYIAYYQFNESEVPLFSMDMFGKALYPSEYEFKYPKAGEKNSEVSIHIYNLKTQKSTAVNITDDYEYIPRIKWTPDNKLVVFSMNRLQNELKLWKTNPSDGKVNLLYTETAPAYLEVHDNLRFLADGSFIWTSEKDGYNHIYLMDKNGKQKKQLTKGAWDVTQFYGIDEESGYAYYQSAEEHPTQRQVYRIKLNGKGKKALTPQEGWNTADFSEGFKYLIQTHSSVNAPTQQTLLNADGNEVRTITDNTRVTQVLDQYILSNKEFFDFKTPEGVSLNGWMVKPTDFDENKEYPVLMFVYGGPGAQTVKNQYDAFNHFYYQTLADQGYIIVSVDNRGTGARGRDFRTVTYKQLGKYEVEDQIAAAKYLGGLSYVNADRIGIWGWSYGGYMSSLCITKGADVFKMAIAVAPVTNWRFYDSIYTERYMQTPQENGNGYDDNSPINHVDKLEGAYLLVHGTADDNVHFQNTTRMISALVDADKQFDLFVYPDKNHGISGGNTRYHLYTKMTNFIKENL